jgi:hypothetical protein
MPLDPDRRQGGRFNPPRTTSASSQQRLSRPSARTRERARQEATDRVLVHRGDLLAPSSLSADPDIPSRLQIDHRHHRPEVGLDAGQQLRRIDFLSHETLSAHAELDARFV